MVPKTPHTYHKARSARPRENGEQCPFTQKSVTQEMIHEKYPKHSWIHAYTDGSAEEAVRNGGSGIFLKFPDKPPVSLSFPVGKRSSNYRAEVHALIEAARHLIDMGEQNRNIALLTDSLSALQALSGSTDNCIRQLQDGLNIPSHMGIQGNEVADKLAKAGSQKPQPNAPVSYNEAKTLLKGSFKAN